MKQNLGKLDRIFRFVVGLWLLGYWGPTFTGGLYWFVLVIGWVNLTESYLGYCYLHKWFGINNKNQ